MTRADFDKLAAGEKGIVIERELWRRGLLAVREVAPGVHDCKWLASGEKVSASMDEPDFFEVAAANWPPTT